MQVTGIGAFRETKKHPKDWITEDKNIMSRVTSLPSNVYELTTQAMDNISKEQIFAEYIQFRNIVTFCYCCQF